jgi:YbgC/YbaW family acyl-CoA thioester hydrolase
VSYDPGSIPGPEPQLFETCFRVRFHEVDALGHVNNAAYLNYLEQAAIDHASFLGLSLDRLRGLGGVFVARRHDITFLKPTFAGDQLCILTWLEGPRGARIERRYIVFRKSKMTGAVPITGHLIQGSEIPQEDAIVVRAMTEWVFAGDKGQPRRIPHEVVALFRSSSSTGEK